MDKQYADKLLSLGLSLIPVRNKRPLVKWEEFQERRATKEEVHAWLSRFACDLGIVTGPISNLLVLDVDHHGPVGYPVPQTWKVRTKRGYHLYFKWPTDRLELGSTLPGTGNGSRPVRTTLAGIGNLLDARGAGGYVVAPGSRGYVAEVPFLPGLLAPPPQWLLDKLGFQRPEPRPQPVVELGEGRTSRTLEVIRGIKEGNRNDSFASLAGTLRRSGLDASSIFELLRGRAETALFPLGELRAVCESVCRYAPAIPASGDAESIEDFLKEQEPVEWICEGLIPKKSIGFVAGLPESLKTWLLVDLAISVSGGAVRGAGPSSSPMNWISRYPVSPGVVLFLDQERHKSETARRFAAVMQGKGLSVEDLRGRLFVRSGGTTRIDLEPSFEAFKRELSRTKPDVVVIDSFATFSTAQENDRASIQVVLERIKALRNEYGCTFIFIDHENKAAWQDSGEGIPPSAFRMVGSVAKPAAAEFVFTVRKQDSESCMVFHTKSTLGPTSEPFAIRVRDLNPERTSISVEAI